MTFIQLLERVSFVVESIGCLIMLLGFGIALIKFLKIQGNFLAKGISFQPMQTVRLELGTYLLLGLEFMVVGDIIGTVLKPGLNELTSLVVIVMIRTAISYFLGHELETVSLKDTEKEKS